MSRIKSAIFDALVEAEMDSPDGEIDYQKLSNGITASLKSGIQSKGNTSWDSSRQTTAAATSSECLKVSSSGAATA